MCRLVTALVVFVLLCVPSLTRAYQPLRCDSAPTFSFSKSFETPPDKIHGSQPLSLALDLPLVQPLRILRVLPVVATSLGPSSDTAPPDSLRAPPVA